MGILTDSRKAKRLQSAASVRRQTCRRGRQHHQSCRYNPLPPCGGRPVSVRYLLIGGKLQSAASVRRQTNDYGENVDILQVTIRCLRAEADPMIVIVPYQQE